MGHPMEPDSTTKGYTTMLALLRDATKAIGSALARPPAAPKPANVLAIANAVLDELEARGETANLIRLQRLVCLAQLWHLALLDRPMFDARMDEICDRPSLPDLHSAFRRFDCRPITDRARIPEIPQFEWPADTEPTRVSVIRSVVSSYSRFDGYRLGTILEPLIEGTVTNGLIDQGLASARLAAKIPVSRTTRSLHPDAIQENMSS